MVASRRETEGVEGGGITEGDRRSRGWWRHRGRQEEERVVASRRETGGGEGGGVAEGDRSRQK